MANIGNATKAVVAPNAMNDLAAINAALGEMGLLSDSNGGVSRIKVKGSTFVLPDGEIMVSNQKTKAPAFYARILDVPLEWQGVYLEEDEAKMLNRPELAGRFCKSEYWVPEQGGKTSADGYDCGTCPIKPYIKKENSPLPKGKKCQWRATMLLQLCDEMGNSDDPTEYELSLSTTSVIEMKGTSKEKNKGSVSEYNFMTKLARWAIQNIPAPSVKAAIDTAAVALKTGHIIASVRLVDTSSGNMDYSVISFDPVNMVMLDDAAPQVAAGEAVEDGGNAEPPTLAGKDDPTTDENLPF